VLDVLVSFIFRDVRETVVLGMERKFIPFALDELTTDITKSEEVDKKNQ
jgi:hypothetical protein